MKRICIVLLCLLVGCTNFISKDNFTKISSDDMMTKIMNRESFLVFIDHDSCDPCTEFRSQLNSVIEEKQMQVYILNYSDLDFDAAEQLELFNIRFSSWPVLLYVKDGVITIDDIYEFSLDPKGWKQWLNKQTGMQIE